jgi:hypothetical protein
MIPKEKIEQAANKYAIKVNKGFKGSELIVRRVASENDFKSGVRFAEAEMNKPQTFEIDFCGHVKAKIEFKDGKLSIIAAMNGYGDAIDPDQITITPI